MRSIFRHFRVCRALCMALVVLLLGCSMLLPVSAASESYEAREWELSDDGRTLTSGFDVYTLFTLPTGYYLDVHTEYYYFYSVYHDLYGYVSVVSPDQYTGLIWLELIGDEYPIYADEEAVTALNRFIEGEVTNYRLKNGNDTAIKENILPAATLSAMDSAIATGTKKEMNVSDLKNVTRYDVTAHDETDSIAFVYGAVYELDGKYYYLNYGELGNQYFDADGNFSYRSGNVTLTELDGDLQKSLETVVSGLKYRSVSTEWETSGNASTLYDDEDSAITGFWCALVFFGLLLPIAPLIIGLVLPHSQKRGYPKYWYILAIAAGLWMFFTIVLMFVVGLA